jgi:opacity protein-like surface antigen
VDASGVLGLGQEYFQQSSSPAQWFFNQAVSASQGGSTSANSSAAGLDGRAFQGRLNLGILPISIRGKAVLGSDSNVLQPIVSYDLAIARNTNFYAGAGYSFFSSREKSSATNNQDAFFVIAGAEAAVSDKVIVYGDAQYPLNQLDLKSAAPVKVQLGIGFRF